MRNSYQEKIEYIEDKDFIPDNNWYYHKVAFSKQVYLNILTNGILSSKLQKNKNSSYSYVFVSKASHNTYSAFHNYSIYPNFIINKNIPALNVNDGFLKKLFYNGFYDLKFTSLYKDEYQVYNKIKVDDIIGISYSINRLIQEYPLEAYKYLMILYELTMLLKEMHLDLPIIDFYAKKEINKNKVLTIFS